MGFIRYKDEAGNWQEVLVIKGEPGYTPQRDKDYWTPDDKAEIKGYVDDAILGGAW